MMAAPVQACQVWFRRASHILSGWRGAFWLEQMNVDLWIVSERFKNQFSNIIPI